MQRYVVTYVATSLLYNCSAYCNAWIWLLGIQASTFKDQTVVLAAMLVCAVLTYNDTDFGFHELRISVLNIMRWCVILPEYKNLDDNCYTLHIYHSSSVLNTKSL